jgi:hypothetical protein
MPTTSVRVRIRNEKGMALVGVMLLLILASGVCAALAVSGKTETMAAYNLDTSAQARAAAQAGLTASAEVLIDYLKDTTLDVRTAMTVVLRGPDGDALATVDNGSLYSINGAATGLPTVGVKEELNNITGVSYTVQVLDDDNWSARGVNPAGSNAGIEEDGSLYNDDNKKIAVRAIGFGRNNTTVVLEGIISRPELGGIVVGANLIMGGAASSVTGTGAGVHANGSIDTNGNPLVEGTVSASGIVDGHPDAEAILEGQDPISIPPINAADFLKFANWRLTPAGWVQTKVAGAWVNHCNAASVSCAAAGNGGVSYSGGVWEIESTASGCYYAEGDVTAGGSFTASVYTTGDFSIGSHFDIIAAASSLGVALVSDGDIFIDGGSDVTGSIYARETVEFGGNHTIIGQVVAENRSNPAAENWFHGNVDITWNGDTMIGNFGVSSWREVK